MHKQTEGPSHDTRVFQIIPNNHSLPSALIRPAIDAEASAHQLHGRGRDPQHSSSLRLRHVEVPGERGGPLPFSLFGLGKAANDLELQGKEANDLERMMSDPIGFILGISSTKEVKKHDLCVMCDVHCLYVETRTRNNLSFSLSLSLSLSPYKNV